MTRFYEAAEIIERLDVATAIESQRRAFTALGEGTAVLPPKTHVPGPDGSLALAYPSRVSADTGPVCKFVSFNPGNAERGLPSIHGMIVALHAETGVPVAVLDGAAVTTIRTSAGSAVAVDALAGQDASVLAVLGSGVQAVAHVRAIAAVRPLRTIKMYSPNRTHLDSALGELDGYPVEAAPDAESAVRDADVVALCTVSAKPVIQRGWLASGATVVSVGSFEPHRHEVGADTVAAIGSLVVDHRPTALEHAGPVRDAVASGAFAEADIQQLGAVLIGISPGRKRAEDLVYYNSTGLGVQDAAAAWAVVAADRG